MVLYCRLLQSGIRPQNGYQFLSIGGLLPALAREYVVSSSTLRQAPFNGKGVPCHYALAIFTTHYSAIAIVFYFLSSHWKSGNLPVCGPDGANCICPTGDDSTPIDGLIVANTRSYIGNSSDTIEPLGVSHAQLLKRLFDEYGRLGYDKVDNDGTKFGIEAVMAAVVALDQLERDGNVDLGNWSAVGNSELFRTTKESLNRLEIEGIGGRFSFDEQQDRVPDRIFFDQVVGYRPDGEVIAARRAYYVPDEGLNFSEPEAADGGFVWPGELHVWPGA